MSKTTASQLADLITEYANEKKWVTRGGKVDHIKVGVACDLSNTTIYNILKYPNLNISSQVIEKITSVTGGVVVIGQQ